MRQLRLVHLTDDGTMLLLESPDAAEQFHLPVDAVLRRAVRTERPRPVATADPPAAPEPGATIGPREIQMRVRAGESPESLAQLYDTPLDRILRFAAPVVDERVRIADEARRGRARRTTTDGQVVVFGEAVDERFAAHGLAPADVTWDAVRPDGEWLVIARWLGGLEPDDEHTAEWVFHRASRTVTPVDDTAIDLLSDRPIRPIVPAEPEPPAAPALPPFGPGVFVFPPMPDAATGPVPRVEEVFDQDAPADGPRELPPLVPARAASAPSASTEPTVALSPDLPIPAADVTAAPDLDEPPLPLGTWTPSEPEPTLAEKLRRKPARRREGAGTRTKVPAWDDILLGVRRESE
jgi:hypothetical protein